MGLNETPLAERIHIGFFGQRNAGKSSVVNAVTGQQISVVSDVKGTTTDPVQKAMELLPLGPVVIIDTPGFDDEGALGQKRIARTKQILNRVDCAVLVVDATVGICPADEELIALFQKKELPYLLVYNKKDCLQAPVNHISQEALQVSAATGENITLLKEKIAGLMQTDEKKQPLASDLVQPNDVVVLVVPIDKAAPKGRLILPQQQVIRDLLDAGVSVMVTRDFELPQTLQALAKPPALVITDSQVFGKVSAMVPAEVPLTSFSILMARYKGFLDVAVQGVCAIDTLQDGDKVLISEGCTHHRQCDDIGTVKIPAWLRKYTQKELQIETSSGRDFPENLQEYKLVIHCGGCMLNEREMRYRQKCAQDAAVPFTNYGIAIAQLQGILKRSIEPFPHLNKLI